MPVDRLRDIRNSLRGRISTLFTAPPDATMTAFAVYDEQALRNVQAGTLTPTRPCVFLTSQRMRPAETALPLVVIETEIKSYPFEIGNTAGKMFRAWLHCFGRQKGEASLLASFLQENLRPLKIYDYSDPDAPVEKETALLATDLDILEGPALTDEMRQLGAFDHWFTLHVRGWTRDAS